MMYEVTVHFPDKPFKVLCRTRDWVEAKEQFNFWANEYRDSMDSIRIRVRPNG